MPVHVQRCARAPRGAGRQKRKAPIRKFLKWLRATGKSVVSALAQRGRERDIGLYDNTRDAPRLEEILGKRASFRNRPTQ